MDTRQLAAFCAVVDRKSFSLAAEQLGVTQPAVSLQIRSLEKRLGQRLLDRSGRRVEPTEAGQRLYRSAQRLLAIEEQLLEEVAGNGDGGLKGQLEIGCSTGPGATVLPLLLCQFQEANPGVAISLSVNDTQHVIDLVAERELELGVVGAATRHRGVSFEPFFRDEVVLAVPPDHRFAGKTVDLEWGTVTGGWVVEDYYRFRGKKYSETTTSLGRFPVDATGRVNARIVVPETPVRVEYELTEKGRALEQALCAVGRWAERWVTDVKPAGKPARSTTARGKSARA